MIFYDADGYRGLENKDELKNPNLKQWANFITEIDPNIPNPRNTLSFDLKNGKASNVVQIRKSKK